MSTSIRPRKGSDCSIEYQPLYDDVKPQRARGHVIVGGLVCGPVGQVTTWAPHPMLRKEKIC